MLKLKANKNMNYISLIQFNLTIDGQIIVSIIVCLAFFRPPTDEKFIVLSLNKFTLCSDNGTVFSKALFKIDELMILSRPPILKNKY